MAHPATKLSGKLLRKLPPNDRMDADNLLLKLDLKRDVVYTTGDSPLPEDQQFQFRDNTLLTPAKGDARLCIPAELGKYYQLSIRVQCLEKEGNPRVGIGVVFGDRQFLIEGQAEAFSFGEFHGRRVEGKFAEPSAAPPNQRFYSDLEVLVGECGWLYVHRGKTYEWVGPPKLLSLDPKWAVPDKNKVFLTFPDGQFAIIYIKIKSLDRDAWLHQVRQTQPLGRINWAIETEAKKKYPVDVEPLPSHDELVPTLFVRAREGNFDELEQWAERFRREQSQMGLDFAAWHLYDVCTVAYAPNAGRSPPALEPYWQQEFAFLDAWRAARPDSVAARIVAGLVQMKYARSLVEPDERLPRAENKKLFDERIAAAEKLLNEAAELSPPDSCVFTSLLMAGKVRGAPRDEMDKALRLGLAIAPKNYSLYDLMVEYLLSKPGEADTVEKFADASREGLDENEGWHVYGRIAEECKRQEANGSGGHFQTLFAGANEKLASAVPPLIAHYADDPFTVNFACWLCCELNEPEAARPLFALIKSKPNIAVWGTRAAYDTWRHTANPEAPDSSELLANAGEEMLHLQAYSDGLVHLGFLPDSQTLVTASPQLGSVCNFWSLRKPRMLVKAVPMPHDTFSLLDLRISPTGDLGLLFQDGRQTVTGKLRSPDYEEKFGDMHIQRLGRELQSDNLLSQVVVADGTVTADHLPEGKRARFNVPPKAAAVLSGDGKYLLTVDKKMQLWDAYSGKEVPLPEEVKPKVFCFGRDSASIIYATGEKLVVWDIAKQQNRFSTTYKEPNLVRTAATSADGRFLATGERRVDADGTKHQVVVLWSLENSQPIHVFEGHRKSVDRVFFSPDGQWLASSSLDGIVKVWDVVAATRKDKAAPPKP